MSARYAAYTPPLRISQTEWNAYIELISQWHAEKRDSSLLPKVLVMGATPDFYGFPWASGTDLLAVDHSSDMLAAIWPGNPEQRLCQDWTTMDLPDASRDVVLCDGGFTFINHPEPLQQLAENVARIMAPGGRFITRLFVNAVRQETPAELFAALEQGNLANINELKLRLWLALNSTLNSNLNGGERTGVRLADVWRCFSAQYPSAGTLAERSAWPESEWHLMKAYEGTTDTYYFPSVEQISQAFQQTSFKLQRVAIIEPDVLCGQHLRLLSFRRPD
jgi:SAM-dependent methyltransferase